MERQYYIDLANHGLRMPIGSDLVLHEHTDAEAILSDGVRLGKVLEETAYRFETPLALPHMDLELEHYNLLEMLDVPRADIAKFHFAGSLPADALSRMTDRLRDRFPQRVQAHIDSVAYIAEWTNLLPIGMVIGPFSLMTKLLADAITPICLAGNGLTAEDDEEILAVEQALELASG